ncbi:hypothetical protein Q8A67_025222 [Cirrhinus molitorella]|uniref:Uncharacterized protein n=1 Tax=Cirrhinus molitorella TaxID=172907 RepID=A0AA88THM4_9TELE|nr:hypothetical protein Q8A67_025222 [Cirrhinus molitorella]
MKELLPVPLSSRGFIVDRWRSLFMGDSSNNEVQPNSPRRGVERHGEVPVGVLQPGISCPERIMPAAEPAGAVESSRNPHCSVLSVHTS